MSREITVKKELTSEFLADVLISMAEGGINYWAMIYEYKHNVGTGRSAEECIIVVAGDDEPDKRFAINLDVVALGIKRILDEEVQVIASTKQFILRGAMDNDGSDIDADCADVIAQAGLFGQLVYV